ncbi:MAG TPA: AAA family ATPase [Solirubrobacterales bacterium]|jgi:hypothetical protein
MSEETSNEATAAGTGAKPVSARHLLVEWANKQDGWIRQLVSEVLRSPEPLTETVLDAVFDAYLKEKGLADGEGAAIGPLELDQPTGASVASFVIDRLSAVSGVNALAEDQAVDFNANLTILFGENGSGKTGYIRIFKTLGAVRTAEPILPNVREPSSAARPPTATLDFTVDGSSDSMEWRGEKGVAPFTYIAIFDSPAVQLHVDEDLAYKYTPGDLGLFPKVNDGITAVRSRLTNASAQHRPAANPFLSHFTRGTPVYALIEPLGAATDLTGLREAAKVGEAEEKEAKEFDTQITALEGATLPAQLSVARTRRDLNDGLKEAAGAVLEFDWTAYNQAVSAADKADAEYAALRSEVLTAAGLEERGEADWQTFILSAEAYRKHIESHESPQEGDPCLYCRQPLDNSAARLVRRYREFADDASRRRASDSRELAGTICRRINDLNREALGDQVGRAREGDEDDPALEEAERMLANLDGLCGSLEQKKAVDWTEINALAQGVSTEAGARTEAAEKLIASLTAKEETRAEQLARLKKARDQVRDRLELKRRLPEISAYVESAQWAERADKLQQRFTGILRSLTGTAKAASEEMLNADFAGRFAKECETLRAPAVGLEFPGREGKAARRKTVSAEHKPSVVLSEGEQKVIALADFLAEAALRLTPAPLVLDDPVSSLDYRRIKEVAGRLAELAEDRQVIVFTHNIWFATELLARFEGMRDKCSYYNISDDESGKGVITRGTHPRWDTIGKTKAKLNEVIASARTSQGEAREALIERGYSLIRTWSEIAAEKEFLAGVSTRYEPHIGMTKLRNIKTERLSEAIEEVLPVFEKACRITEGHSQPLETLGIRPSLEELEADWKRIQDALKAYNTTSKGESDPVSPI